MIEHAQEFCWLIESVMTDGTPSMASYYAGYSDEQRLGIPAHTTDPNAAPRWARKEDADIVAGHLMNGINFHWVATEHGFIHPIPTQIATPCRDSKLDAVGGEDTCKISFSFDTTPGGMK
jgi:hypothetical protein